MTRLDSMTTGLMQGHVPQLNLSFFCTTKVLKIQIHTSHEYCSKIARLIRHDFKGINTFVRDLLTQSLNICEIKKPVPKAGV